MAQQSSILILGKPKSSKTTFLAQFFVLARKNKSMVKFWKTPENIQPIQDAIGRLRKGEETQSTPADQSLIMNLPVELNGKQFELKCPDYGGEQINSILEQREIDPNWVALANNSDSWLLFIRPHLVATAYDLSNKSSSERDKSSSEEPLPEFKVSEQSNLIELLQFMLSIKKVSYQLPVGTPKLSIALTCWDEVKDDQTPNDYFSAIFPLLDQFIKANWSETSFIVTGLSAQGFDLKDQGNKDKYLDDGPDKFCYIVKGNSTEKIYDLTAIIADSL
jgi:hypothetical protein